LLLSTASSLSLTLSERGIGAELANCMGVDGGLGAEHCRGHLRLLFVNEPTPDRVKLRGPRDPWVGRSITIPCMVMTCVGCSLMTIHGQVQTARWTVHIELRDNKCVCEACVRTLCNMADVYQKTHERGDAARLAILREVGIVNEYERYLLETESALRNAGKTPWAWDCPIEGNWENREITDAYEALIARDANEHTV
jgi:hypothetical protein